MRLPGRYVFIWMVFIVLALVMRGEVIGVPDSPWSRNVGMPTARSELSVTKLDGRIYAAGGIGQWGTSNSFEVYDPETGTWTRLASMPRATHHPAIAAAVDHIFLTGGYSDIFFTHMFADAWVYDPKLNRWDRITSMPEPRAAHR